MSNEPEGRCLRCDGAAGYNRVVYDLVTERVVGSLCRNCELDRLSPRLEPDRRRSASTCNCLDCARDALVSFPRWLPETTISDGAVESVVSYDLSDTSLLLCDEHLDALVSCEPLASPAEQAPAEFR